MNMFIGKKRGNHDAAAGFAISGVTPRRITSGP
jgi:hypothetical protein